MAIESNGGIWPTGLASQSTYDSSRYNNEWNSSYLSDNGLGGGEVGWYLRCNLGANELILSGNDAADDFAITSTFSLNNIEVLPPIETQEEILDLMKTELEKSDKIDNIVKTYLGEVVPYDLASVNSILSGQVYTASSYATTHDLHMTSEATKPSFAFDGIGGSSTSQIPWMSEDTDINGESNDNYSDSHYPEYFSFGSMRSEISKFNYSVGFP